MKLSRQGGFTYVELLTALALLAILAVIAVGRFNRSYEHALRATLVSDLRNLATAQELYFRQYSAYTTSLVALKINPSLESQVTITEASPTGWAAWNSMERTAVQCEFYVGTAPAPIGVAPGSEQVGCGTP